MANFDDVFISPPPEPLVIRPLPLADERIHQVSLGGTAALEVLGKGASIEAGFIATPGHPDDYGVYVEIKIFFGGAIEKWADLKSGVFSSGKLGPSATLGRVNRVNTLFSTSDVSELQIGPVTYSPENAKGESQVQFSAGIGYGGRTGKGGKLQLTPSIFSSELEKLKQYIDGISYDIYQYHGGDSLYSSPPFTSIPPP